MEDWATKFADVLEDLAGRVRSLTVDRVARWAKLAAFGLVTATLAIIGLNYIIKAIFRATAVAVGDTWAYVIYGGLFVIVGLFVWLQRKRDPEDINA